MVTDAELLDRWRSLFAEPTEGWDFSSFAERIVTDPWPWDYHLLALSALTGVSSALDLSTGGGEVLSALADARADALPEDTVATEGWAPNLPVARAALAPLGIEVVAYDAEVDPVMPFVDDRFDLVLNRHEAMSLPEVARVLRPGGEVLTQQVDGRNFAETHALFGGSDGAYGEITLEHLSAQAEAAGLQVEESDEWQGSIRFADVDTLVSYWRMVPWEVPDDFSIDRYAAELLSLHHDSLVDPDRLTFGFGGFYFRARLRGSSAGPSSGSSSGSSSGPEPARSAG